MVGDVGCWCWVGYGDSSQPVAVGRFGGDDVVGWAWVRVRVGMPRPRVRGSRWVTRPAISSDGP